MPHMESADDELAITRSQLQRATRQLVEKDLEVAALKEELAWLRRDSSPTEATEAYSTSSNVVDVGGDDNL